MEINFKNYIISDDKDKIQPDRVHELLSATYWANERDLPTVKKSIKNSLCFGIYADNYQIGFARCVTDYATIYWLADVIIDEKYRGLGLGKFLIETVTNHKHLKSLKGILGTNDAHGLYEKYGFQTVDGRFMRK